MRKTFPFVPASLAPFLALLLSGSHEHRGIRKRIKDAEELRHEVRAFYMSRPLEKVQVGDIEIGYKRFGEGEPLFMIPAFITTMDVWDPNFLAKLASKYRVFIFDNRGMGETTAGTKEFTIDRFADDTNFLQ